MAPTRPRTLLITVLLLAAFAGACGDDTDGAPRGDDRFDPDEIPWGVDLESTVVTRSGRNGLVPGTQIHLAFHDDQRTTANAGCNTIGVDGAALAEGRFEADAGEMTEMGCEPERHAQDEWLAAFLASSPRWSWDGTTLVLTGDDDTVTLTAVATSDDDAGSDDPDAPVGDGQ